jgi:hypothetical protein
MTAYMQYTHAHGCILPTVDPVMCTKYTHKNVCLRKYSFTLISARVQFVQVGWQTDEADHTNYIFYLPTGTYLRFAVKSHPSSWCICYVTACLVYKYHIFKDNDITLHPPHGVSIKHTPSFFF